MARELRRIDISEVPDVQRLAEEVARSGVPHVLRIADRDVAVISPPPRARKGRGRSGPLDENDPLASIIGIAALDHFPDVSPDVSANKHECLADAYDANR